ncbi:MAG: glycoside hydrolase family 5 protein [Burkholderiales bacterium]|nr:glycoside hydrolase family 5 protein [Burkholderiales bacterium]
MNYLFLLMFLCCASVQAGDVPPNWPWRGMAIESNGGDNDTMEIARLAKLHVNAVELMLTIRSTAQYGPMTPEAALDTNLMWADRMLDACKQHGMVGIITFSDMLIDPELPPADSPDFWGNPQRLAEAANLVGKLAQHFKSRGNELGAYEILSEPLVRRPPDIQETPRQWPQFRDEIIRKIRKSDPNRYVILTPGFGGESSSYQDFKPLPFGHIIYGVHVYNPHGYSHQGLYDFPRGMSYPAQFDRHTLEGNMKYLIDFKDKYHALIYVGEFSAVRWAPGANQYVSDLIDLFDKHGFSWMYFCYNSYHAWSPFYDEQYVAKDESPSPQSWVGFGSKRWAVLKQAFSRNGLER